jgi:hypothetical protein
MQPGGKLMRQKTEMEFMNILDTLTGADGGVTFIRLKGLIEEMDRQAAAGDSAALEVIKIVHLFNKLIDIAQKDAPKTSQEPCNGG